MHRAAQDNPQGTSIRKETPRWRDSIRGDRGYNGQEAVVRYCQDRIGNLMWQDKTFEWG